MSILGNKEHFMKTHADTFRAITKTGRGPRPAEVATAEALWRAATRSLGQTDGRLSTLSSPTGYGKSKAAVAMMAHLAKSGQSGTLVLPEIALIEENYLDIVKLIHPSNVAVMSSLHGPHVQPATVSYYSDLNIHATRTFTETELDAAPILITTHTAWLESLKKGGRGRTFQRNGKRRSLIIVDEQPKAQDAFMFSASEVASLCEALMLYEPNETAYLVATLRGIQRRLECSLDPEAIDWDGVNPRDKRLATSKLEPLPDDLVTGEDQRALGSLNDELLFRVALKLAPLRGKDTLKLRDELQKLVSGLRAAQQGRVFVYNGNERTFTAYTFVDKPVSLANTVCLDGTIDLDILRAATTAIIEIDPALRPTYKGTAIQLDDMPDDVAETIRNLSRTNRLPAKASARLREWLREYILNRVKPGESALVYMKSKLMDGLGLTYDPVVWEGRTLHFTNHGAGKGSNTWSECDVYIQLDDFHLPRGIYVARLGATLKKTLSSDDLLRLGQPRVKDEYLDQIIEAHHLITVKQNAARVLRTFDDKGNAASRRVYLCGLNRHRIVSWADTLWPEAALVDTNGAAPGTPLETRTTPATKSTGSVRLAQVIRRATKDQREVLTITELLEESVVAKSHLDRTLGTSEVKGALRAGGWRRELLPRGWRLVRAWGRPETHTGALGGDF